MTATLAFIGAGNMASAIIGGLISNQYPAKNIWAGDPLQENLTRLSNDYGINTSTNNQEVIAQADVVILATKPQIMDKVCADIKDATLARKPLIISIAAGVTLDAFAQWLSADLAIVRCMPNTPALLQLGATAMFANSNVNAEQKTIAEHILNATGSARWVDSEAALDAITALSGSGPAYFFKVIELMQKVGVEMGLDAQLSEDFAIQTAVGAAQMAQQSDVDAAELRRRVTSPNGTTEAALKTFDELNLEDVFRKALFAAKNRSEELAQELLG